MKIKILVFLYCFSSLNLFAMWEKDFLGYKNKTKDSVIDRIIVRSEKNVVTLNLLFSLRSDYQKKAEQMRRELRAADFDVPPPVEPMITDFIDINFFVDQTSSIKKALAIIQNYEKIDETTVNNIALDFSSRLLSISRALLFKKTPRKHAHRN